MPPSFALDRRRLIALLGLCAAFPSAAALAGPETSSATALVATLKALNGAVGWKDLDRLRAIRWGNLKMHAIPFTDGSYFARAGTTDFGRGPVAVTATGARWGPGAVYFRNPGAHLDPTEVLAALQSAGFAAHLVRCPAMGAPPNGPRWYRLTTAGKSAVTLGIDRSCTGAQACAPIALRLGGDLPILSPHEARITSDDCAGSRVAVIPPGAPSDEERIAIAIAWLLPSRAHPGSAIPWKELTHSPLIAWKGTTPRKMDTSAWLDANPYLLEGEIHLPTRLMTVFATGTAAGATNIHLRDDTNFVPTDIFSALRRQGFSIALARCSKPYTRVRDDWFRITGPRTASAVLFRSRACEGNMCAERYALLRDNRVPIKAGQRRPGVAGCHA